MLKMLNLKRVFNLLAALMVAICLATAVAPMAQAHVTEVVASAGRTITVTDRDNNRAVNLTVGDILVVQLASNASTGYTWQIGQNNARLLTTVGAPKYVNSASGMMGAQGTQIFTFRAIAAGGDGLALLYQKPSLGGVQAANTFRLRVVISAVVPKPTHTPTRVPTRAPTRAATRTPANPPTPVPTNAPTSTPASTPASTSITSKTINLIDEDNNGTVTAAMGDILIITLDSNQTTGFSWMILDNTPAVLKPIDQLYQQATPAATPRVGVGGTQQFTFQVVGTGTVSLKMLYQRAQGTEAGQAWQILVEVPDENAGTTPASIVVHYSCSNNVTFAAVFSAQDATVTYQNQIRALTQQPAADGFAYADDLWALRGVGDNATLTDQTSGQALATDCTSS